MLIGKFKTVKNFIEIYKNKNKKSLIKCCILTDKKEFNYFNELKIPCFDYDERFFEIENNPVLKTILFFLRMRF